MKIRLVTTDGIAGTENYRTSDQMAGMSGAATAFINAGLLDRFAANGVEVEQITNLAAAPDQHADPIAELARINANIAAAVSDAMTHNLAPVFLGGNCSHTIGVLAGIQGAKGATARIGLLWLDAHGDFNTPGTSYSQMLGGMPVAVAAGLAWPAWREGAGMSVPLPTNRIVMVDVRNLDDREEQLIRATDVEIARFGENWDIAPITAAIDRLAANCDLIYVHVDADILDESLQPNHPTVEPNGPLLAPVVAVLNHAFATGKVGAFAIVSINVVGEQGKISLASGSDLLVEAIAAWARED